MTKSTLCDLIQDYFDNTADYQNKYHPLILREWIASAWSKVLFNICIASVKRADYAQLDPFIKPYKVPVLCDSDRDIYYSTLPVAVVALPENRGVFRINPLKNEKMNFIFREAGTSDIAEELEWASQNTIPAFWIEGSTIFYDPNMTQDIADVGVRMRLIPEFSEYDDEDVLPVAGGQENGLLMMIIQELSTKQTPDSKSNSFPDIIQQPKI